MASFGFEVQERDDEAAARRSAIAGSIAVSIAHRLSPMNVIIVHIGSDRPSHCASILAQLPSPLRMVVTTSCSGIMSIR